MVQRSRPAPLLALLGVLCLIAAACGSRVVPLEGTQVAGPGGQVIQPTDPGATVDPNNPNPTNTPGTGGTTPPENLPDCKGGATDVGVSADKVKIGLVAAKTGPLPHQFDANIEAVDAHLKMINAEGGICGRQFELHIRDDQGNGTRNEAVARELAEEEKVFAFVGSTSAPDDRGIAKVSREHKIPDIGFPLTYERSESPYTFGVPGQLRRETIGEGATGGPFLIKELGIKQIAILWLGESLVSKANAWAFEATFLKSVNGDLSICYEQETTVLDNNFQNYAIAMKGDCPPSDGPLAVFSTMENSSNIKLADAMRQQDVQYEAFMPTFTSYLPAFIRPSTENAYLAIPQLPFERCAQGSDGRPQPPCSHPELNSYVTALHRYVPGFRAPGSFGAPGWGQAALFVEAVRDCGANLTRVCILNFLETTGRFSANGFLAPAKPGDHRIYTADLVMQVRNGRFTELRPNDHSGHPEAPDIWDDSRLYNWWDYYCAHRDQFTDESRPAIDEFVTSC